MSKTRVLFICTSNAARSQMAEAFLRMYAGDRYEVFSRGLGPGAMNPLTLRVMAEKRISMQGHDSKGVDGFLKYRFWLRHCCLSSNAEAVCPAFPDPCIQL